MAELDISVSQYFECPCCKGDVIEEVMVDVTVSTQVTDIHLFDADSYGGEYEYDEVTEQYGGVIDRFQCKKCGYVLKNEEGEKITDPVDLADWLKEHKFKREKELKTP